MSEKYLKEREILKELMTKESVDEVLQWYDDHAELYDENINCANFHYQKTTVDATLEYVPLKTALILDLGAGTGTIAERLTKQGYKYIDAVDGSQGMLEVAKQKKIYGKIICDFIGTEPIKDLDEGAYDAVVGGAVFAHGAVYYESIPAIMKYLKTGGYFIFSIACNSMRVTPRLAKETFVAMAEEWEKGNLCKFIEEKETFHINKEPAKVFVFQKL